MVPLLTCKKGISADVSENLSLKYAIEIKCSSEISRKLRHITQNVHNLFLYV